MALQPFVVKDCALICRTAGLPPAANLRELRDRVSTCPQASLYHHFCETKLRPYFDDPEYPNDFAVWAIRALRDSILAERLAMLNGFDYEELEVLRSATLEILDERLTEIPMLPWAIPGEHFEFLQAMTVVFDTGIAVDSLPGLHAAVANMSRGSIYFHFVESRRRQPVGQDDFSSWLESSRTNQNGILGDLHEIDFHLLSLPEMKSRIVGVLRSHTNGVKGHD